MTYWYLEDHHGEVLRLTDWSDVVDQAAEGFFLCTRVDLGCGYRDASSDLTDAIREAERSDREQAEHERIESQIVRTL